jgi:hypothetical protein
MQLHDDESQSMLIFAEQLGGFREHLEAYARRQPSDYASSEVRPLAAAWLELLDRLADGQAAWTAISDAIDAHDKAAGENREAADASSASAQIAYQEAVRRHELAVQVTCPYCGAAPGATCRAAGADGASTARGINDHRDRWRSAQHLTPPEETQP